MPQFGVVKPATPQDIKELDAQKRRAIAERKAKWHAEVQANEEARLHAWNNLGTLLKRALKRMMGTMYIITIFQVLPPAVKKYI